MTMHYVDFELNGDHYPVNTPATLVAETDVQPASNRPDAEDERVLVRHWFLINNTPVFIPMTPAAVLAMVKQYENALVTL